MLGLDTFAFHWRPGGNAGTGVDHLGSGFYVWEVSFPLLVLSQIPLVVQTLWPRHTARGGARRTF